VSVTYNFAGKDAVVVGGSRGIGKQVCLDLLESNANVTYISRSPGSGLDLAGISHAECDIRNTDQVKSVMSRLSNVDILVNAAAINFCKPSSKIHIGEWDEVLEVNLRSYFLTSQMAIEKMKNSGGGKIVNVSSIAGRSRSLVSGVHYTSSKAGIIGLTRQLASEVGQYGINVNVVCPSQTMTDMLIESMSEQELISLASAVPVRRLASVKDQSQPILFLCSSAADYITGSVLDVNGGQL